MACCLLIIPQISVSFSTHSLPCTLCFLTHNAFLLLSLDHKKSKQKSEKGKNKTKQGIVLKKICLKIEMSQKVIKTAVHLSIKCYSSPEMFVSVSILITSLNPLTVGINLPTVQNFAGRLWIQTSMWMHIDKTICWSPPTPKIKSTPDDTGVPKIKLVPHQDNVCCHMEKVSGRAG